MPFIQARDLDAQEAEALRVVVVAREPYRLAELADWLQRTSGPLDELDASVESLVPLWAWFLERIDAGLPEVPQDARPANWVEDGEGRVEVQVLRMLYAAETLAHYVRQVARRLEPPADWVVVKPDRRYQSFDDQATVIGLRDWHIFPQNFVANLGVGAARGSADRRRPESLRDTVRLNLPEDLRALHQPPGPPVLRDLPLPAGPAPRWTPPARLLAPAPPAPPAPAPPVTRARAVDHGLPNSDFYLLSGPDEGLDDLTLLRPLDSESVAAALTELGFRDTQDQPVTAAWLLEDDHELGHDPDELITVATSTADGTLRLLDVEAIRDLTVPEGRQLVARFAELARRLDARLLTDAENLADDS